LNPEHKKYIIENIDKKSIKEIASALRLKKKVVKRYLEKERFQAVQRTDSKIGHDETSIASTLKWNNFTTVGLIIILGFIIYFNSFHNQFVYDDVVQIVNNKTIRSFSNVSMAFAHRLGYSSETSTKSKFYRPVQVITLMADYYLWGLRPLGYHITNTILHILVCILVFLLFIKITDDILVSSVASVLYLVHPIHTEAVAFISGRADSLCTIFLIAMILFQFNFWNSNKISQRVSYYLLILTSFILALLSKELSLSFPILLIFTQYCLNGHSSYTNMLSKKIFFYIPFVIIIAIYMIIKNNIVPTIVMVKFPLSLSTRLIIIPRLIYNYLQLSVMPIGLHMDYRFIFPQSIFQRGYFEAFLFMMILLPFIYYLNRKGRSDVHYRIIFFGLGWFLIALLPYLNIFFLLNALFSEHWVYISEIGLILSVVYYIFLKLKKKRIIGIILFCIVILLYSGLTIKQNTVWKDNFTMFKNIVDNSPHSPEAHCALAEEYVKRGDLLKAREILKEALQMNPEYPNSAILLKKVDAMIETDRQK